MRPEQRFLVMPWLLSHGNKVKRQILQKFNNIHHVNSFKKQLTMIWISVSLLVHASLNIGTLCIWMAHKRDTCNALLLQVRGKREKAGSGGLSKVPSSGKSGTECLAASLVTIQRLAPSHPSELRMTVDLISGWCPENLCPRARQHCLECSSHTQVSFHSDGAGCDKEQGHGTHVRPGLHKLLH